ncbi:acyl-CoA dehydrogenase [Saccharopolyspora terrae]|uniref:Acyl-CoA dehydrogenase n=1 Tax=Saccharopolyspora terrae TaxID=2530384 RepID=A0A4R4VBT8_9PSEU|nr:acyl-CoA dehydrogenase family protein [Saccharopolyspora terrae]TDC99942.1 acyl-CoA dehydrogenase [Saccharopolyspora terrae]
MNVPNTADEILAAACNLAPTLAKRSDDIERARRLPADVVEMLRRTGVFRMCWPAEHGGPDLTIAQQVEVLEALAYADASAAWCSMINSDCGVFARFLPESALKSLFPTLDTTIAGMVSPMGRAKRVSGGYRLSGRWSLASGITHADRVFAGAHIVTDGEADTDAAGNPSYRLLILDSADVTLHDTWHSTGLVGTGSIDFEVVDVFVQDDHVVNLSTPRLSGPLATPEAFIRNMPGVPLGVARAALNYARDTVRSKNKANDYRIQKTIGECERDCIAMRHAVYSSLEHHWRRVQGGNLNVLSPDERIEIMLVCQHTMRASRRIVRRLYDLFGSTSVYTASPLGRWSRDLDTICQHVLSQDVITQSAGAYLLGGTPSFPLALGIVS